MESPLLQVDGLSKDYHFGFWQTERIQVLKNVSFTLKKGEILGLVGESGSGKSTLARLILKLEPPTKGKIFFQGKDLAEWDRKTYWRQVQLIFQNPYGALNPRWRVYDSLCEPLFLQGERRNKKEKIEAILSQVGLSPEVFLSKYPHELSGGERQRVVIARALLVEPKVLVCDEPVSALDVSVQAQILNLLLKIQKERNLSLLFISHDLGVVYHMADRILVMYLGHVLELGPREAVYRNPLHPYTRLLLESVPEVGKELPKREEEDVPPPSLQGCPFYHRCPYRLSSCETLEISLKEISPGHWTACPVVSH